MNGKEWVRQILTGSSEVRSIAGQNVYADAAPQETVAPLIVFQRIGNLDYPTLGDPVDLEQPRYLIQAWTRTGASRDDLAHAVRSALETCSAGGNGVLGCSILIEEDTYEPPTDASEVGWFRTTFEVMVTQRRD